MNKSIGLIVLTCDNYSDLWPMFIHFFDKFWPDCPYSKYVVSNYKSLPDTSFEFINIGKDDSWSDGLLKAISVLKNKHDYLLVTLEDSPIIEKVDQFMNKHLFPNEQKVYEFHQNNPWKNYPVSVYWMMVFCFLGWF